MDNSYLPTTNYQDPRQITIAKLKRWSIICICIIAFLIVLFLVYRLLFEGRLVITTNNKTSTITITQFQSDEKDKAVSKQLSSGQTGTFTPGTYLVTVQNSSGATSKTVTIKARHTSKYTINTVTAQTTEPVADVNSPSFAVGQNGIEYFDQYTNSLNYIDNNNTLGSLGGPNNIQSAQWADDSFGVAQSKDGNLFLISNGKISQLNTPFSLNQYFVTLNRDIYATSGNDIYFANSNTGFEKIYTTNSSQYKLIPSGNEIALLVSKPGSQSNASQNIEIISGQKVVDNMKIDAYSASWSPNSEYIATTNDSSTQIFDKNLKLVDIVPSKNVNNLSWLDSKTLLYSINNQLWKYSITKSEASEVGQAGTNEAITYLWAYQDNIYLSVESRAGSSNDLNIMKVSLTNQNVPNFLSTLHSNLPWLDGTCLLSLTNFTKPTIQSFGGLPQDNCPEVAQNYVNQLGIDSSKLDYKTTNIPPDESTNQ